MCYLLRVGVVIIFVGVVASVVVVALARHLAHHRDDR